MGRSGGRNRFQDSSSRGGTRAGQREVTTDEGCRMSVEFSHRGVAENEWKDWPNAGRTGGRCVRRCGLRARSRSEPESLGSGSSAARALTTQGCREAEWRTRVLAPGRAAARPARATQQSCTPQRLNEPRRPTRRACHSASKLDSWLSGAPGLHPGPHSRERNSHRAGFRAVAWHGNQPLPQAAACYCRQSERQRAPGARHCRFCLDAIAGRGSWGHVWSVGVADHVDDDPVRVADCGSSLPWRGRAGLPRASLALSHDHGRAQATANSPATSATGTR